MRILHVATGFALSYPGGVTNYVRSLSREQAAQGHHVEVLAGRESTPEKQAGFDQVKVLPFDGVATVFCLSLDRDDKESAKKLVELLNGYDLVHFHMSYGFPASLFKATLSVPYMVSLHDYGYICPRIFMVDKWGGLCETRELSKCSKCVGALEQVNVLRVAANRLHVKLPTVRADAVRRRARRVDAFLLRATDVLAVSQRVATIYEASVPGLSCSVVHIGNDSAGQTVHKSKWLSESGKLRCCYLGTLNKAKGAEVFISLVRDLGVEKFEFQFWGRGEQKYVDELKALGVNMCGSYQPNALAGILQNVDVGLVLPVWHDNGPQVLMEFVNNKVPVLATRMGGVPDFVQDGNGRLFSPDSAAEYAQALAWMRSQTPQTLQSHSDASIALKTPQVHAVELVDRYEEVVHA